MAVIKVFEMLFLRMHRYLLVVCPLMIDNCNVFTDQAIPTSHLLLDQSHVLDNILLW